ncbi:MAG TPA: hypothetical protein VG347_11590 [Verrucomicrobiae bacterium]|nr:hypothetical protein [Verrucomicrobiae bacterium]
MSLWTYPMAFATFHMKAIILTALFYACCMVGRANENIYITDDGQVSPMTITNKMYLMPPDKLEAAKHLPECLPAQNFPKGNWGAVQDGYQLSMRFEKQVFTNGEPIVATLLMRNVTNIDLYLHYSTYPVGFDNGPVRLAVTSGSHLLTPHKFSGPEVILGNSYVQWLMPGTQAKYIERLDQRFDLPAGAYVVQAIIPAWVVPWPKVDEKHHPTFNWSLQKTVQVKSAEVKIIIKDSQ